MGIKRSSLKFGAANMHTEHGNTNANRAGQDYRISWTVRSRSVETNRGKNHFLDANTTANNKDGTGKSRRIATTTKTTTMNIYLQVAVWT